MANGSEEVTPVNASAVTAQELLNTAFTKLKEFGAGDESLNLFPGGIGSLDLEIDSGGEQSAAFRLALKISAAPSLALPEALTLSEEDDTQLSFNTEGHHVIAQIAFSDLQMRLPNVAQKVQQILDAGNRLLTEAATFPDDIRNKQPETKPFHFIDIPFYGWWPSKPATPSCSARTVKDR